jgi:hypothetical protein
VEWRKSMPNKLEDRVKRYIKMKKFFMFSDALIITGIPKDILLKILERLEKEGFLNKNERYRSVLKNINNMDFSLSRARQNVADSVLYRNRGLYIGNELIDHTVNIALELKSSKNK